jgi:dephospho-CoA kinase
VIIVGLTGGIASGKSTVAALFRNFGAVILDADIYARQAVMPGRPAWQAVRDLFGGEVFNPDGTIRRARLGHLVFNQPRLRRRLEQIIHPHVGLQMAAEIDRLRQVAPQAVIIEDIPLLFEAGMTQALAEIIVVYAPVVLQLKRLIHRDGLEIEAARARITAQMPIGEKCRRATIVINNNGALADTRSQALKVFADLQKRAAG